MLTLPVATILKQQFPEATIGFLGKSYTSPVIECCSAVDVFVDEDDFLHARVQELRHAWDVIIHIFPRKDIALKAWLAGIPVRIGTSSRPYHWLTCNKLVKLKRRHSGLHEAELNTKLLTPLGINKAFTKEALGSMYSFDKIPSLPAELSALLEPDRLHVILHPKSQGSAREWGLERFEALIQLLPKERFQLFISGTTQERVLLEPLLQAAGDSVTDITGKMSLSLLIAFIARCDGLVAASTGPLHIAAALGKRAIGIYPSMRPMHAGRWGPLGPLAQAISFRADDCRECHNAPGQCLCMSSISAMEVAGHLTRHLAGGAGGL